MNSFQGVHICLLDSLLLLTNICNYVNREFWQRERVKVRKDTDYDVSDVRVE